MKINFLVSCTSSFGVKGVFLIFKVLNYIIINETLWDIYTHRHYIRLTTGSLNSWTSLCLAISVEVSAWQIQPLYGVKSTRKGGFSDTEYEGHLLLSEAVPWARRERLEGLLLVSQILLFCASEPSIRNVLIGKSNTAANDSSHKPRLPRLSV